MVVLVLLGVCWWHVALPGDVFLFLYLQGLSCNLYTSRGFMIVCVPPGYWLLNEQLITPARLTTLTFFI